MWAGYGLLWQSFLCALAMEVNAFFSRNLSRLLPSSSFPKFIYPHTLTHYWSLMNACVEWKHLACQIPFPLFLKKQLPLPLGTCHSCIPPGAIWGVNYEAFFTLLGWLDWKALLGSLIWIMHMWRWKAIGTHPEEET